MEYISIKKASELWNIDASNIGKLCRKGKIKGAKIIGRNWLIPMNTPKPIDGRTKQAKNNDTDTVFRFPLFFNFDEKAFNPPLSAEEARLRQAQADFYGCNFTNAKIVFEELAENAQSIYVKICADFFMCVLSAVYDLNINREKYYYGMNLLLTNDFHRKKEMELFLPYLDFIIGRFASIPEKLNTDASYEYHHTAIYMNTFLSAFNFSARDIETKNIQCVEPFETLSRIIEHEGYCIEAQELHMILFFYYYGINNETAAQYHIKKAVELAYQHNLLFAVADALAYYPDAINAVLGEYSDIFAHRIHESSKIIYDNFSVFANIISKTDVYEKLSKNDYRYVFYAVEGFTNKQVAEICNSSERTVAKRYNEIYNKLDIKTKQELIKKMCFAFGNRKQMRKQGRKQAAAHKKPKGYCAHSELVIDVNKHTAEQ